MKRMSAMKKIELQNPQIDIEWLELIIEARRIGLSIEEVQQFLYGEHIHCNSPK